MRSAGPRSATKARSRASLSGFGVEMVAIAAPAFAADPLDADWVLVSMGRSSGRGRYRGDFCERYAHRSILNRPGATYPQSPARHVRSHSLLRWVACGLLGRGGGDR